MLKNRFTRLLMWMGLAAVATYLLDPDRGEERRKGLRKQVSQMRQKSKKVGKEISKKANLA
jgi:gas vesicle protein